MKKAIRFYPDGIKLRNHCHSEPVLTLAWESVSLFKTLGNKGIYGLPHQ
jgi:hypothetical protein